MKSFKRQAVNRTRWGLSRRFLALGRNMLFVAGVSAGTGLHAQQMDSVTPWMPGVVQAIDAYVPDPTFLNGHFGLDHFAGPNGADEVGAVTAQMDNGDIVVAGLVKGFGVTGTCNNGTALCNIGLVRYNQSGARVAWSDPGVYGFQGNQYVIYGEHGPNVAPSYQYIRDVKVKNGAIYVMVDTNLGSGGSKDVRVVSFNNSGSPIDHGLAGVFGFGNGDDFEAFFGAQIAIISSDYMVVTATGYDATGPFVASNRLHIESDHSLSQDPAWGVGYGGGTDNRIVRYFGPGGYCGQSRCDATANYAVAPVGLSGSVYIGGTIHISGDNYDPIAIKISSDSGVLKAEFNGTGWSRTAYDQPNSSNKDTVAGLYVYQNDVYMAAQVAQKCFPGIGLAKLDGTTGDYVSAFSAGGKIVFGGQGNAPFCFSPPFGDYPTAISATGGRIGIVGYSVRGIQDISTRVDPMLAVVNAVNGTLLDFDSHPVTDANGNRLGDAALYSVYGGSSATSPFTVAGNGRIASAGNTLSYLVGKLIPASADRIFASGFGVGDEH